MNKDLLRILKRVQSPARYVGKEVNMATISEQARVRFCLCYPGLYEEGMDSKDVRVIYHLLNDKKGYNCERAFAPFLDMARELKNSQMKLFSLETQTELDKFNCLGFVFNKAISYTNFIYMLNLSGVSLLSKDRKNDQPFVFGLGSMMANPEPIGNLLDFALIGDYEDLIVKVIDTIMKCRLSSLSRAETLAQLAQLEGVYVPSLIEPKFGRDGRLERLSGKMVRRQIVRDLDRAYFPNKLMLKNEGGKDCAMLEPLRGCSRCCRFCQSAYMNRPLRERRVQTLVSQATSQLISSGLDHLQICSLEPSDYSSLSKLVGFIDPLCASENATWTMENHHLEAFQSDYKAMKKTKQITINVEAASQRLRDVVNKQMTDDELDGLLKGAFKQDVTAINLVFKIGLPFETSDDLMSIVAMAARVKETYKKFHVSSKPLNLTIVTNTFVPLPFTPFQWCAFVGSKEAKKRQAFLEAAFSKIGVRYVHDDADRAEVEAILARGDRRLGQALLVAVRRGAVFPEMNDLFSFKPYKEAFEACGVDIAAAIQKRDEKCVLPWDKVDSLLSKAFFAREYQKAQKGLTTSSCKQSCANCGLAATGGCKYGSN